MLASSSTSSILMVRFSFTGIVTTPLDSGIDMTVRAVATYFVISSIRAHWYPLNCAIFDEVSAARDGSLEFGVHTLHPTETTAASATTSPATVAIASHDGFR